MGTWNPREGLGAKPPENGGLGRSQCCLANVNSNFTHTAASSPLHPTKGGASCPVCATGCGGTAGRTVAALHQATYVDAVHPRSPIKTCIIARRRRLIHAEPDTAKRYNAPPPTAYYSGRLQQQYHCRRCSRFPSSVSSLLEMRLN